MSSFEVRLLPNENVFRHRTVGKGFVEDIRFEITCAVNNRGPNFTNGVYNGTEDSPEDYMNAITQKVVTEFDQKIVNIEKTANLVFSLQWLPKNETAATGQSCLRSSTSPASCGVAGLGDYNIPICDFCETAEKISELHKLVVDTTGDHVDPRLDPKGICWPNLGNRLKYVLKKLQNKAIAQVTDWKKLSHVVRAVLMHNLSVKLTEVMLKEAYGDYFRGSDFVALLMARNRQDSAHNVVDENDIGNIVQNLLTHLMEEDHTDDVGRFQNMTSVEGLLFRRNEREDHRYFGVDYEKDDYVGFHDTHQTPFVGEVYGRLVASRKRILFNPLRSTFVDPLIYETSENDFQRLASLGINVGQVVNIPVRRLQSARRCMYWDFLEGWPACDHTEGPEVNSTETKYKCTIQAPMCMIDHADAVTQLNNMGSPIELL